MTTKIQLESNTLSAQVRDYILSLIARQKLTVGMPVPSEMQLTQELGVSKGVVREAYRSLAALGILETKSGKVPRIKAFDSSVLQLIFSFATVTEQVTSSQILTARRWLEAQRDHYEYERGIIALHQRVCDCVCRRDAEGAMKAMDDHFNLASTALNNFSPSH